MAKKYEIISKREYIAPSPVGYVWLKQYTLIKRGKKKCVIVRFSNEFDAPIDKLFFTLEQIDADGKEIKSTVCEHSVFVGLDAGISFEKEFAVDENCVSIAVQINKISSCGNEYCLKNGQVLCAPSTAPIKNATSFKSAIKPNKNQTAVHWKLIAISVAAIIIIFGINLLFAILQW